ncbi:hypothetical protein Cde04nite_27200 [Cellulomonas denverensis]|nr:hypothetical protein Cde04nite_27200 [Cellulomonas denverensis]
MLAARDGNNRETAHTANATTATHTQPMTTHPRALIWHHHIPPRSSPVDSCSACPQASRRAVKSSRSRHEGLIKMAGSGTNGTAGDRVRLPTVCPPPGA